MDFTVLLALIATALGDLQKISDSVATVSADLQAIQLKAQAMSAAGPVDPGGPNPLQAQLDAALAQVAQLNQQLTDLGVKDAADVQAAVDAKAAGDAAVADLQVKIDALAAKEGVESKLIQDLQGAKAILESIVAQLAALPALPVDPAPAV